MRRAIDLAASPDAPLHPNPRVGCVLLSTDGSTLAEGHHRGAGTPHAEADALAAAGERARGATAVVTLEPCAHTGRTPPCADALVDAGVARVVFAQADPSTAAAGGSERLHAAGVSVESGLMSDEAVRLNPYWTFAVTRGRPFVTWKFAATLDGRSAASDGSSRWITSVAARRDVHRLRAECDAVVVGTGTVLTDDPQLTVRPDGAPLPADRQPLRVVVGRSEIPARARVLDESAPSVQLRTHDVAETLADLHRRERRHVWLEGGPTLAGAFWRTGLVDEVVAYLAPVLLGSGRHALGDSGVSTIDDALRLRVSDLSVVGEDLRLTAVPLEVP